jgi:hypothetical protein
MELEDALFTELEFRAGFILQEAAQLARHARRATISAADVALAQRSLSGGRPRGPWQQAPGSAAARLILSAGPLRVTPLGAAALLGGGEGGSDTAALAGSREAAATLAAVTSALSASLRSGSAEEFSALLAGLAGQHGEQLVRLMPAVVSSLRAALEGLLLAPALSAGGGGGGGGGTPDARQLHCLLHIIAGVAAQRGLPVEDCSGELLALLGSLLLHREGGGGGETAEAAAAGQQLRELAAEAFVDFVERVAVQWPQVTEQACALLLDAAAGAALAGGEGGAPPTVAISAPATLMGALAALARLPAVPPAQRPLLQRLLAMLEAHWEEAGGGGACGAGLGNGGGALGSWDGAARRVCARAQRRHFGGGEPL